MFVKFGKKHQISAGAGLQYSPSYNCTSEFSQTENSTYISLLDIQSVLSVPLL